MRRKPKTHEVKCYAGFFKPLQAGEKTAELRYNDRNYRKGDTLVVREYKRGKYTGRGCIFDITHVLKSFGPLGEPDPTDPGDRLVHPSERGLPAREPFKGWAMLSLRRWPSLAAEKVELAMMDATDRLADSIARSMTRPSPFLNMLKAGEYDLTKEVDPLSDYPKL